MRGELGRGARVGSVEWVDGAEGRRGELVEIDQTVRVICSSFLSWRMVKIYVVRTRVFPPGLLVVRGRR